MPQPTHNSLDGSKLAAQALPYAEKFAQSEEGSGSKPQCEYAVVEQDRVGECIEISYASGTECHGEDVSHKALLAVIAGLGAKGWELVAATDAFSPSERRIRSYAFKRLHDEARGIFE
jgi:hypothetical protein